QKVQDDHLVTIISGGGSGHEPAHFGFVGMGLLTAAVYGEIFTPPTAEDVLAAIRAVDKGKGVCLIVKNFEADLVSFR
ncbi:dihydroxyacetone kinase subunit DhaK, partial [Streptococcus suis]